MTLPSSASVFCPLQCCFVRLMLYMSTILVPADAPVILSNSSCDWDGTLLSCFCAVDSNPRPAVTWSVNGTHLPDGYNASFSYFNHILMATLSGFADASLPVECYAINSLGNDSHVLCEAHDGTLQLNNDIQRITVQTHMKILSLFTHCFKPLFYYFLWNLCLQ